MIRVIIATIFLLGFTSNSNAEHYHHFAFSRLNGAQDIPDNVCMNKNSALIGIKNALKLIQNNPHDYNYVSHYCDYIKKDMQKCDISYDQLSFTEADLKKIKKNALQSTLVKTYENIIWYANFRSVDFEVREYKKLAKIYNQLYKHNFSRKLKTILEKGKKNQEINKANCTPLKINIRKKLEEIAGDPRDQSDMKWCFAFAASDLLSYESEKKISALAVAHSNYDNFYYNIRRLRGEQLFNFEKGVTYLALIQAIDDGLCLEKNIHSEFDATDELENTLKKMTDTSIDPRMGFISAKNIFPSLTIQQYLDYLENINDQDLINFMINQHCQKRIDLSYSQPHIKLSIFPSEKIKIFNNVDEILEGGRPLSFAYDVKTITGNKERNWHSSLIIDRRFNEKNRECEYLVRNSWGPQSTNYLHNLDVEKGNIWVPKSNLARSILNITWLD